MMARTVLVILTILLTMSDAYAELGRKDIRKREKILNAIAKGIVDIYDIPLNTYIRLGLWDHIGRIFNANAGNMIRHPLPGQYHSRPYIIGDEVCVFENSNPKGSISILKPDSPDMLSRPKHPKYGEYEGNIRVVAGHSIISGGGDKDVDTAVLWNIKEDSLRTLTLKDGHYITSIAASENHLHIGSCGGKINEYQLDTLQWLKTYSTSADDNLNWETFNRKECIAAISLIEGQVIGVGEKTVYIWARGKELPVRSYPKALANSTVSFYRQFMIEHRQNELVLTDMTTRRIRRLNLEKTIEDVLITSEKVLKNQRGNVLIVSLRDSGGLWIYDFETLSLIEKTELGGDKLSAAGGCILATDEQFLYRYYLPDREPEKFAALLKDFRIEDIAVNEDNYYPMLKLAHHYPDLIDPAVLARKFLSLYRLNVSYSFRYGKTGERKFEENGKIFQEDIFGYRLIYTVDNHSDRCYSVSLDISRSGYYGQQNSGDFEGSKAISKQSCVIPPHRSYSGVIVVGEKEPLKVLIYPTEIRQSDAETCE